MAAVQRTVRTGCTALACKSLYYWQGWMSASMPMNPLQVSGQNKALPQRNEKASWSIFCWAIFSVAATEIPVCRSPRRGRKAGRQMQMHHLPAFVLPVGRQSRARGTCPRSPLFLKGIIAASGYWAQMWAQAPVCIEPRSCAPLDTRSCRGYPSQYTAGTGR